MGNGNSSQEVEMMKASTRTGSEFASFQNVPKPIQAKKGFVIVKIKAAAVRFRERDTPFRA